MDDMLAHHGQSITIDDKKVFYKPGLPMPKLVLD